jgi:hypothetical protein
LFQLIHLFSRFGSTLIQQIMNVSTRLFLSLGLLLTGCVNDSNEGSNDLDQAIDYEKEIIGSWDLHCTYFSDIGIEEVCEPGLAPNEQFYFTEDSIYCIQFPYQFSWEAAYTLKGNGFDFNIDVDGEPENHNGTLSILSDTLVMRYLVNDSTEWVRQFDRSQLGKSDFIELQGLKVDWSQFTFKWKKYEMVKAYEFEPTISYPEEIDLSGENAHNFSYVLDTLFYRDSDLNKEFTFVYRFNNSYEGELQNIALTPIEPKDSFEVSLGYKPKYE